MKHEQAPARSMKASMGVFAGQFFTSWEYPLWIIVGTIGLFGAVPTTRWYVILLYFFLSIIAAFFAVFHAVWQRNKALESLGFADVGYGHPRWIVEGPAPLMQKVIKIHAAGYAVADFHARREHLAMRFQNPIRGIHQPNVMSPIIHIELQKAVLSSSVSLLSMPFYSLQKDEFFLGMGDGGPVKRTLSEMIHMLVAGQTGMGKTTFLKQFMTTVIARIRNSHVCLIDMKGGIDYQAFAQAPNFEMATKLSEAERALIKIEALYDERVSYLEKKKKEKWADLHPKELQNESAFEGVPIGPIVLVVDELAELSKQATKGQVKSSLSERLSRLARLARAASIHVVLGTQRPDKSIIDMQIKENMHTKVCFYVPSVAASTLVVNDMSASTIGKIPGRAVLNENDAVDLKQKLILQSPIIENARIKEVIGQSPYLVGITPEDQRTILSNNAKGTHDSGPDVKGL